MVERPPKKARNRLALRNSKRNPMTHLMTHKTKENMMLKRIQQLMTVAALLLVVLAGTMPAHALVYSPGDAVLVIYGNDNEGYLNLGNWNTVKVSGGSFDVSS